MGCLVKKPIQLAAAGVDVGCWVQFGVLFALGNELYFFCFVGSGYQKSNPLGMIDDLHGQGHAGLAGFRVGYRFTYTAGRQ